MKSQYRTRTAEFSTLVALLRARVSDQPDKCIYTFLLDGEQEEAHATYADVDLRARSIAAALQRIAPPQARALLLYQPGLDYIAAVFGCLYAGIVAVPTYLPDPARLERTLPRLHAIAAHSQPAVVLTTAAILPIASAISAQAPAFQSMQWLATDTISADTATDWREPDLNSATLAFLQYTSGSTATPKGVMLTHGNLLHNSSLIADGFGHTADSRGVIWLPPYHDMGLIGGILQPLYAAFPVVLMSPVDFLARPFRWLQAISRYRATTSGGPNFAYDLCVRKVTPEQRATLDLSSWTVAFNGAEPIRPDTLERFAGAFASCGFRQQAFYPCYGLAEATLIVTGGHQVAPPATHTFSNDALGHDRVVATTGEQADARSLASSGRVLQDQTIAIVDPERCVRCPADSVGEIWVSGPSVAQGYWDQPAETAHSFQAHLADSADRPFLRTGDLGFVHDGELFVTGRLKDVLIIRGRNYYPQDIELTVERTHPALRPGCGAVFSVEIGGEERPIVVQEIDRKYRDPDIGALVRGIRQAVTEQQELRIHEVVLIRHGSIPKTSSGKIQRHACREGFLNGSLDVVGSSTFDDGMSADAEPKDQGVDMARAALPVTALDARTAKLEADLRSLVARIVGVDVSQVDPQQSLSTLGLDSLMAIELKHALETDAGVVVPLASLLHDCSIEQIAKDVLEQSSTGVTAAPLAAIPAPVQSSVDHPLSYGQQAIWFLQQLAPESTSHSIVQAVRIGGYLNIAALQRAFQRLVQRHAALRTSFLFRDGVPIQQVHAERTIAVQQEDAVAWSEADLNRRLVQEAQRPFDLQRGPLLRIHLFTRSVHEHILLLVVHHIVTDFWSLVVLMRELDRLYCSESTGAEVLLPALSAQYTDYVAWEAAMLAGPEGERLWAYWQRQLVGQLPVIDLPLDHPRPSIQTYRGASYPFTLSKTLSQQLKALAQSQGVTLYVTLLTAFQVLLYRYTGQEDMLVGSPVAGRSRAAFAEVVGYFMNPVVMRADLSGNLSFALLLDRVRQVVLGALAHQEYPAHLLVERLRPSRDSRHSALFQLMFVLNKPHRSESRSESQHASSYEFDAAEAQLALGDLAVSPVSIAQQAVQFDLTLTMVEAAEALSASLQYSTDLFDAATMARLADHFQTLLASVVADCQQRICDIALLTAAERQQLLVEWNGARRAEPLHLCLHNMVEAQVARTPDACAVVDGEQQLSYAALDQRANQLAHYLQRIGIEPEARVALCMERSLDLIVGLLGVLKAGGAYVPLDPTYPAERLAFIIENARAAVLLSQRRLAARLPHTAGPVVYLDAEWPSIDQECRKKPCTTVTSQNLAYIIYTSGSTGNPKGVMIPHGSLVSYVETASTAYAISPEDCVLQFASISFDTSNEEIGPCLASGARLVLRNDAMLISIAAFLKQCQDWGITVVDLPTSYWHELVDGLSKAALSLPPAIRLLIIGGERALVERRLAWHHCVDGRVQLLNTYGPTETTVVATMANLSTATEPETQAGEVPIGRAIDTAKLYVLDRSRQLVPVGVPGQLFIGGAGLARGYLDSPTLTAERFIPSPFADGDSLIGPGARLYMTGDLVRYRPHGALEFLGRLDDQVKVRGFRVELGEVETVLNQHAAVRTSVVLAREDMPGNKRLVAYVVPNAECSMQNAEAGNQESGGTGGDDDAHSQEILHSSALRNFLKQHLPDYMVPSAFVVLDTLPLMPNGKVDRAALPAPSWARATSGAPFVAPRTFVEQVIAEHWAEILGVEQVGVYDNFFEIGGHSLLAIKLIARLRDALQIELPLHNLFEMPTIAALAEHIAQANQSSDRLAVLPIQPIPRDRILPLSFSQEHLWFLDKLDPNSASYHVPRAIKMTGQLDIGLLERTFSELVRRHEILRTTFPALDGQPIQVIHPPQPVSIPLVDLRSLTPSEQESEVERLILAEGQRSFDLDHGPLLRLKVFQLGDQEQILLLSEHHLIHDGWTQGVLLREFIIIYTAFANQHPIPLPELPIQFADFAYWQREWLQGDILETQLSYWKKQLAGAPSVLDLPLDHPRPAVYSSRGSEQIFVVPAESAEALRALSRREGSTLFMTMLAVFQLLLYRYSGQDDILIGSPVANRRRREIEGMLGMIINTIVLRTDLSGNPTFRTLLQRVRTTCLDAYAHQDLPFEKVVEAVHPKRSLSYNPLFQVMFGFQDTPTAELELPGLTLQLLDSHNKSAKFDLSIVVLPLVEQFTGEGARTMVSEITAHMEYNTDIFNSDTIARMINHYQTLLRSVALDPDQHIAALPLLTDAERHHILVTLNENPVISAPARSIHQLVAAQAERTPNALAVCCGEAQLTYQELDQRANQLAQYLQSLGVGPEVRVGICVESSLALPIGLLGILKAGGAYVPLDPTYPPQRLTFMIEDAQLAVLLIQASLAPLLPPHTVPRLCLDADWSDWADQPISSPAITVSPQASAYVIYTSGSTGQPKGVVCLHAGVLNLLAAFEHLCRLPVGAHYSLWTSISFDVSVYELFSALGFGGQLHLPHKSVRTDPAALLAWLARAAIESAYLPPFILPALAEWLEQPGHRSRLCRLLVGVEPISEQLLQHLRALVPGLCLINGYGPSEASICATLYVLEGTQVRTGPTPIGRPVPQTTLYLLDEAQQPVPIGVAGEIYLGGVQLARGYLNRPELTAERFVPNPFAGDTETRRLGDKETGAHDPTQSSVLSPQSSRGARLYRTGDRARYLPDGTVLFLGRLDRQFKLRGYRVEPGEVEAVLGMHPAVRKCVMMLREIQPGDARLVAYVVPTNDQGPTTNDGLEHEANHSSLVVGRSSFAGELRAFLQERLPDYMVPSAFVVLDALPLTPNAKLDYHALPAPDWTSMGQAHSYVAPRTPFEELLAGIWIQVLGVERVGVSDNFFEAGGHSLLATQLLARVRETFEVDIPLRSLLEGATIADLAQQIALMRRSGQRLQTIQQYRVAREGALPTSFAQQQLWLLDQLGQNRSLYNVAGAVHISGLLNSAALEQAINKLIGRHETLRTTFIALDGRPSQIVAPRLVLNLPVVDLRGLSAHQREDQVRRLGVAEARQPFDLSRGPLLRCTLLRLDECDHVLLLTTHHIVADGWSIRVLMNDLAALYQACATGSPSPLPALPIQYADFAHWQRQWMQGDVLERQLSYWKEQLGGNLPVLDLSTDHVRPSIQTFQGSSRKVILPPSLTESLKSLSQQERVTLFMTLLAAFQVLLARYTHQDDILVGTPIANRTQVETEGLIGVFVNMLALRTDLSGNPSFQLLLKRVREVAVGAYAHQDLPFERLVEELQPERSLSHTPLVQVTFALQNVPTRAIKLPDLTWNLIDIDIGTTKFDLTFALEDTDCGLIGDVRYSTDLFETASIDRLMGHFRTLLDGIVANRAQPIASLPLLTDSEREQLLVTWNATRTPYRQERCLHQLIAEQAARTPDAPAVVFEDQCLSYRTLNERANQLAHYLRTHGIGPEKLVGICIERSLAMVVGILGILKAGGAYIPLDPSYPQERIAFMLADANVTTVVTQQALAARLEQQTSVVCLDRDWQVIERALAVNSTPMASTDHPAYVIYTSGSTGRPKGVMITHRALCNHMDWMQAELPLGADDCVLQKTPISFDASVWEFYAPLLAGAVLALAQPGGHQDSAYLVRAIVAQQVTVVQLVPVLLRLLLAEPEFASCTTLRRVFCGGETLPRDLIEQCFALLPATSVYNLYGPTEATIDSTWWQCERGSAHRSVPIGRPIANAQIYLLDAQLQPVPLGVPGELHIGGAGLARGYLGRPDLTAERFIPNPFVTVDWGLASGDRRPGDRETGRHGDQETGDTTPTQSSVLSPQSSPRLYRTGDLARYHQDGSIEFLGRLDQQIKLHGFRIELEEIEAVLRGHPRVREVVVLTREDAPGDQRLVAYVGLGTEMKRLSESGTSPTQSSVLSPQPFVAELRDLLKERLPEYMVPSAFVLLDALPLTPNGKVDRRRLPAPSPRRAEQERAFIAPRTPVEELLAGIWASVLGAQQVSIHDNFFAQGGHSLLAAQIVSRVRQVFQVELPLRSLFEAPTVAALAERVVAARQSHHGAPPLPPINPVQRDGDARLPLSLAQHRLWVLDQFAPGNASYNIPFALRLRGRLAVDALQYSLDAIVQRHEVLRTTFATVADQPVQIIAPALRIALPVIDLEISTDGDHDGTVERLIAASAQQPFDLGRGPLLRAQLLRLGEQEHILLLTMHHILSDGWSINIMAREMTALYQAYVAGTESPLPDLPVQYADFAVWQRAELNDAVLEEQLAYWRRQLAGLPVLTLPTDRPRPAVRDWRGASIPVEVEAELSERLDALSQKEGVTLFMTVLAAFQVLLFHATGQEDIVIGTDVANRNRSEIEGLIGFFTNQVVLRTNLAGQPTFLELLARVREVTLGAYTHQDVPFERLVQELNPQRSRSTTPLFQVKLVFQNDPAPVVQLAGLEVELLKLHYGMTKFDVTLFLWNTAHGLAGSLEYDSDLFAADTMVRMLGNFQALLRKVVAQPATRLSALEVADDSERNQRLMERKTRARMQIQSVKNVTPKVVGLPQGDLVKTDLLWPGEMLPLVIQPVADDIDLVDWATNKRDFLETMLLKHGAVLFRGFGIDSPPSFERFALALCSDLFKENAEHTPVTSNGTVQTPVFFPPDKQLLWHNENSFNHNWPMKIFFACAHPAQQGGETPLVDSRKVFAQLDPTIREQFTQKQVMYIRNYGTGLGLTWQQVFRTTSKAEVEQRCREARLQFEWKDGDRLKTSCVRPAVIKHPKTGELSWFNQAQHWHTACLDPETRDSLLAMFGEDDLPRQCCYGDGSRIEDAVMLEILDVYRNLEKSFRWQQGDIVVLDNLLTAHGRNPFVGERKILVALGAMSSFDEL